MPYYLLNIVLRNGQKVNGIRQHKSYELDLVWRELQAFALAYYKTTYFRYYDCVMLSKQSPVYRTYIKNKGQMYNPDTFEPYEPKDPGRA